MAEFGWTSKQYDEEMSLRDIDIIHILNPIRKEMEANSATVLKPSVNTEKKEVKKDGRRAKSSKFN